MASFNKVILMGNLTRDPELRYTQNNTAICKVGVAVNRRWRDEASGEWVERPTFVDVTIFGKRGEAFEKYHKKGGTAFFEGRLEFDSWDDKTTGQKRSKLYVVAESWEFVGSGGARESGAGTAQRGAGYAASQGGAHESFPGGPAGGEEWGSGDYSPSAGAAFDADDTPF